MNKSLSDSDIRKFLGNKVKVMTYSKLKNIYNIDSFLSKTPFIIVLYQYEPSYGHWCAIIKLTNGDIEFFDPYGTLPDSQLKDYPLELRNKYDMEFPLIAQLLHNSKSNIEYNNHKLQKKDDNITTCGQWCVVRCHFNNLNSEDFYHLFKNIKNKDQKIVKVYNLLKSL